MKTSTKYIESDDDTVSNDNKNVPNEYPDLDDAEFSKKEIFAFCRANNYLQSMPNERIQKMVNIIEGNDRISLRLLDWFVTRYSKTNFTTYNVDGNRFHVHISYGSQLRSYRKRNFDPFRRRYKFNYPYDKKDKTKKIVTTVGQLNFFHWAFTYNVVDYVDENFREIANAMTVSHSDDRSRRSSESSKSKSKKRKLIEFDDESDDTEKTEINDNKSKSKITTKSGYKKPQTSLTNLTKPEQFVFCFS